MGITYTSAVKQSRMTAVSTSIGSAGVLEIGTNGMGSILATIPLSSPAGISSGATLTFSGFPKSVLAVANGTAASARIRTGTGGTDIITGLTVGVSASDINLNSVDILTGQTLTITSVAINHA